MWSATRARRLPSAASSAMRVSRTLTMANSATTKKAFTMTRRTTPMISSAVVLIVASPGAGLGRSAETAGIVQSVSISLSASIA